MLPKNRDSQIADIKNVVIMDEIVHVMLMIC